MDNSSWLTKGNGRYSLGKGRRDSGMNNAVPGPGSYDQSLSGHKGKVTFSKDTRIKLEDTKNPGPGQYDLKPTFADVPKYLLPQK